MEFQKKKLYKNIPYVQDVALSFKTRVQIVSAIMEVSDQLVRYHLDLKKSTDETATSASATN
jgi:hypothetical protein